MRSSILCICAALVLGPGGRVAWSQSKAQLRQLVQDYRTHIRDIDLSYTYQWEKLADEPDRPSDGRIFKETVHLKRQGQKYFYESTSWKDPNTKVPIHHLRAYDGEKSIFYDFAAGIGSIVTGYDEQAEPGEVAVWRYTITVPKDGLHINRGLTKEDFGFRFPPGTRVLDVTAGRPYTVESATDR